MSATPPISLGKIALPVSLAVLGILFTGKSFAVEGLTADNNDAAGRATVFIDSGNGLMCSGVVFRKADILTAAHCVVGDDNKPLNPRLFRVYYSSVVTLGQDSKSVRNVVVHDRFALGEKVGNLRKADPTSGDLAILKMSERHPTNAASAAISPNIITAHFGPFSQQKLTPQAFGIAYGYGSARLNEAPTLRYGQMMIDSPKSKLDRIDGRPRLSGMNKRNASTALCRGDSGGPVFVRAKRNGRVATMRGAPILVGLVMSAPGKSRCSRESRMIDLNSFQDWLAKH